MIKKLKHLCLLITFLVGSVSYSQEKESAFDKADCSFPLSDLIHGYKYGQVVELTEREDGLLIKADTEYLKARNHREEFRVNTFNERLGDTKIRTQVPEPSIEGIFVEEDVTYAVLDKRALLLDVFGPEKTLTTKWPVIIVVHGASWGRGF